MDSRKEAVNLLHQQVFLDTQSGGVVYHEQCKRSVETGNFKELKPCGGYQGILIYGECGRDHHLVRIVHKNLLGNLHIAEYREEPELVDDAADGFVLRAGIVVMQQKVLVEQLVYMDASPVCKLRGGRYHGEEPVVIERLDADVPVLCRQCMKLVGVVCRFGADHDTGCAVVEAAVHIFIADLIDVQVDIAVLLRPDLHEMTGERVGSRRKDSEIDDLTLLAVIRAEIVKLVILGENILHQTDGLLTVRRKESPLIGPAEDLDIQFGFDGVDNGAQTGLADVKLLCGSGNGFAAGNFN